MRIALENEGSCNLYVVRKLLNSPLFFFFLNLCLIICAYFDFL